MLSTFWKIIGWACTAWIVQDAGVKIVADSSPSGVIASVLVGLFFFMFVYMFFFMEKSALTESETDNMENSSSFREFRGHL